MASKLRAAENAPKSSEPWNSEIFVDVNHISDRAIFHIECAFRFHENPPRILLLTNLVDEIMMNTQSKSDAKFDDDTDSDLGLDGNDSADEVS